MSYSNNSWNDTHEQNLIHVLRKHTQWTLNFQLLSYWQISNSLFLKNLLYFEKLQLLVIYFSVIFTISPPKPTIKNRDKINVSGPTSNTEMHQHFAVLSSFKRRKKHSKKMGCDESFPLYHITLPLKLSPRHNISPCGEELGRHLLVFIVSIRHHKQWWSQREVREDPFCCWIKLALL